MAAFFFNMAAIFSNMAAIFQYVLLRNLVLMSHRTTKFCIFCYSSQNKTMELLKHSYNELLLEQNNTEFYVG